MAALLVPAAVPPPPPRGGSGGGGSGAGKAKDCSLFTGESGSRRERLPPPLERGPAPGLGGSQHLHDPLQFIACEFRGQTRICGRSGVSQHPRHRRRLRCGRGRQPGHRADQGAGGFASQFANRSSTLGVDNRFRPPRQGGPSNRPCLTRELGHCQTHSNPSPSSTRVPGRDLLLQ